MDQDFADASGLNAGQQRFSDYCLKKGIKQSSGGKVWCPSGKILNINYETSYMILEKNISRPVLYSLHKTQQQQILTQTF